MRLCRGKFSLYRSKFEKIKSPNPLSNVFCFDIHFNTVLSSLCHEFDLLSALTPFFLQVDYLMDSGEETRVIADILKTFENFLIFANFT